MNISHLTPLQKIASASLFAGIVVMSAALAFGNSMTPLKAKDVSTVTNQSTKSSQTAQTPTVESTADNKTAPTDQRPIDKKSSGNVANPGTNQAQPAPSTPSAPTTPSLPPQTPAQIPHVTLHPENATTSTFSGYTYANVPYTVTGTGSRTNATTCTILGSPLLDTHIWCNGQTRGDFISVQYDNVAVPGHYSVQVTVQINGTNYTATCGLDL